MEGCVKTPIPVKVKVIQPPAKPVKETIIVTCPPAKPVKGNIIVTCPPAKPVVGNITVTVGDATKQDVMRKIVNRSERATRKLMRNRAEKERIKKLKDYDTPTEI